MGEKEKEVKSNGEDLKMITVVIYNAMIVQGLTCM